MKASNFIKLNENDDAGPQDLLTKGDHSPSKPNWGRSSPKQQISPNIWPSKKGSPELEKYMQDMKKPIHRFKDIDPRFKDIDPRHFKDNDLDYLLFKGMEKIKRESKELTKLQELAGVSSVTEIVEPHLGQDDGIDGHPLELLEKVAEQFAEDAANGDYTSIDELLKHVPEAKLKGFLSDI